MSEERIDIVVYDKVSPNIEKKFSEIAKTATSADKAIEKIKKTLASVDTGALEKLALVQDKVQRSAQKVATANLRMEATSARNAAAQTRHQTALVNLAAAQARAEAAASRASMATSKASIATNKAALAQGRLDIAQQKLALATTKAALAQERLNNVQKNSAPVITSFFDGLRKLHYALFGIYTAVQSVSAVVGLTDSYAAMENRLKASGLAGTELANTMERIKVSANSTRSDLKSTVELYSRMALSVRQLGYDEGSLISVTTALNEAILLGGSTTAEASNALIQLSQGMASGRLNGDELRSVLEQMPVVADVIAKHMGITRGELRKFGADGKITTKVIMDAFIKMAPQLKEQFSKLSLTVGQSMTYMKNKLTDVLQKELGEAMSSLAKIIIVVADNIGSLLTVVKSFLAMGLVSFIVSMVTKLKAFVALTPAVQALGTTALPAVATGFGAVGAAGVTAFTSIKAVMMSTIGTVNGLIAVLGVAYYAYNKINEEEAKRLDDERKAANRRNTQAKQDIYAGKRQELAQTRDSIKALAPYKGTALYERDMVLLQKREAALVKELEIAKRNMDASASHEAGETTEDFLRRTNAAYAKSKMITPRTPPEKEKKDRSRSKDWESHNPPKTIEDAYEAINKELTDMESAVGKVNKELFVHNKLLEYTEKMRGTQGYEVDIKILEKRLRLYYALNEAMERQNAIVSSVRKPKIQQEMNDLNVMTMTGRLTKEQRQNYVVKENSDIFAGSKEAMDVQYREYERLYKKIDLLRKNNDISEETSSKARVRLYLEQNGTVIESYSNLFGSLAQLSESSNRRMAAVGKAAATLQIGLDGAVAITKAWASAPWPGNIPAVLATTTGVAVQEAKLHNLAGFAQGGEFTVGGTGGIDSQTVAFRATPGEHVMISTPDQKNRESQPTQIIVHYNDNVKDSTKAERESRYAQFGRMLETVEKRKNKQVAL